MATVLLRAEEPDLRDLLREVLAGEGYPVRVVASPAELVAEASRRPSVAVVEPWGPSQARLREDERREIRALASAVPTVMLATRAWAERAEPAGLRLRALVPTPFALEALQGAVRRLVASLPARERAATRAMRR